MYILAHIILSCSFVSKNWHSCLIRLSGIRKYGSRKPGVEMCQCAGAVSKCAEDEICTFAQVAKQPKIIMRQAGQRNEKMASKQKQQQQQHLMWKTIRNVAQEPRGYGNIVVKYTFWPKG